MIRFVDLRKVFNLLYLILLLTSKIRFEYILKVRSIETTKKKYMQEENEKTLYNRAMKKANQRWRNETVK